MSEPTTEEMLEYIRVASRADIFGPRAVAGFDSIRHLVATWGALAEALETIASASTAHAMQDGDILQGCRDVARAALTAAKAERE
jgi:hypothetical protein